MNSINREQVAKLLADINEAMNRVRANRALATRDLRGDGYEAMGYLDNIQTHAFYGQHDIIVLGSLFGVELTMENEPDDKEDSGQAPHS